MRISLLPLLLLLFACGADDATSPGDVAEDTSLSAAGPALSGEQGGVVPTGSASGILPSEGGEESGPTGGEPDDGASGSPIASGNGGVSDADATGAAPGSESGAAPGSENGEDPDEGNSDANPGEGSGEGSGQGSDAGGASGSGEDSEEDSAAGSAQDPGESSDSDDARDLRQPGPLAVSQRTGRVDTGDGCNMNYTLFEPEDGASAVLVVLAHGFSRGQAQMHGFGEHLASWGIAVATPGMCFLGATNTNHPANGRTLANLARQLAEGREIIVAGYSAGGLAAILAASEGGVAGVFGLDPVDNSDQGRDAADDITAPAIALLAEPGSCNASGNGQAMFAPITERKVYRMAGTTHCDFENPTNFLCTLACSGRASNADEVTAAVNALFTAFVLHHGAGDAAAAAWWTAGTEANARIASLLSALL